MKHVLFRGDFEQWIDRYRAGKGVRLVRVVAAEQR